MADAGYSATPQARKLGLKPGMRVSLVDSPEGWRLDAPPPIELVGPGDAADLVILFLRQAAGMDAALARFAPLVHPAGALWVAWPRKAAGHHSDLGDTIIRQAGLLLGIVDTKVAAIDEDWSALKFVWRLSERRL